MTARPENAAARASREATDWLILLQDEPEDADLRRRFEKWLAASPANNAAWMATWHTAEMLGRASPSYADQWRPFITAMRAGGAQYHTPRKVSAKHSIWNRWIQCRKSHSIGLGLAAAVCFLFFNLPTIILHFRADYVTSNAEIRTIKLVDDSIVVLAPKSAMAITYKEGERRVSLLAGEAFFTVTHDPHRPFLVAVDGIETADIGTAFDIRRSEEGVMIAVQQGGVQISGGGVSETATAGQAVLVTRTGETIRHEESPSLIAAWRQKLLIAQDQPMRAIVNRVRPFFSGTIILTDTKLANQPITGVYNLADPVEALRGIAQAHGAAVHQITPWILLISNG